MTSNELLYAEIEKIYNRDEKSKRFITHLIRSYLPIDKISVVKKSNKNTVCSLSKKSLKGIDDVSCIDDNLEENIIKSISFKIGLISDNIDINCIDKDLIAIQGTTTETFLSQDSYVALIHFLCNSLKNDKHIEWLIRKMEAKTFINKLLGIKPAKKKKQQTFTKPQKTATTKLGDLEILQELKKKLN